MICPLQAHMPPVECFYCKKYQARPLYSHVIGMSSKCLLNCLFSFRRGTLNPFILISQFRSRAMICTGQKLCESKSYAGGKSKHTWLLLLVFQYHTTWATKTATCGSNHANHNMQSTKHFIALEPYIKPNKVCVHSAGSAEKSTCQHNFNSDTNFDLKSSSFIPIAGILELVNRTLVDGISLLSWKRKRRKRKEKRNEEKQRKPVFNRTDT